MIHTERGQQRRKRKEQAVDLFLLSCGFRCDNDGNREVSVPFCGDGKRRNYRVDFVIYRDWGRCIVEVDEDQHKAYPLECETQRMQNILETQLFQPGKVSFVRFNPDKFTENGRRSKVPLKTRYEHLRDAILKEPENKFSIRYLFYDRSSPYPEVCLDPAYPRELRGLVETG